MISVMCINCCFQAMSQVGISTSNSQGCLLMNKALLIGLSLLMLCIKEKKMVGGLGFRNVDHA